MPSRRRILTACVGAGTGLTGCLGSDRSATSTGRETRPDRSTPASAAPTAGPVDRRPGEPYEVDGITVTVSDLRVRHGMVTFDGVHPEPKWVDGSQFLLATLEVEGGRNPTDVDVTATANTLDEPPDRHFGFEPDISESVQPIGFAVPTDPDISEAAVVWDGPRQVRWSLPDEPVAKLGRAPDFSVEAFRAPETAEESAAFDVGIDIANTGDRDGRFLAELGNDAISDQPEVEVSVPVDGKVTATRSVEARFFDGRMGVVLRWDGGVRRRSLKRA